MLLYYSYYKFIHPKLCSTTSRYINRYFSVSKISLCINFIYQNILLNYYSIFKILTNCNVSWFLAKIKLCKFFVLHSTIFIYVRLVYIYCSKIIE